MIWRGFRRTLVPYLQYCTRSFSRKTTMGKNGVCLSLSLVQCLRANYTSSGAIFCRLISSMMGYPFLFIVHRRLVGNSTRTRDSDSPANASKTNCYDFGRHAIQFYYRNVVRHYRNDKRLIV